MVKKNVKTPLNIITSILSKGINKKLNVMKGGNVEKYFFEKYKCNPMKDVVRSQGDCGPDSIAYLLNYDKIRSKEIEWKNERKEISKTLREDVVKYLKENKDTIISSASKNGGGFTFGSLIPGNITYDDYLTKINKETEWVDDLFIVGAAFFLNRCIKVITFKGNIQVYNIGVSSKDNDIVLYNDGIKNKNIGNHFYPLICDKLVDPNNKYIKPTKQSETEKPTKQSETEKPTKQSETEKPTKPDQTKQPEPPKSKKPSPIDLTTSKNTEIISDSILNTSNDENNDNKPNTSEPNTSNDENKESEVQTLEDTKKNLEKIIKYIPDINKTELGNSFVGKDMITELVNQETLIKKMIGNAVSNVDFLIREEEKYKKPDDNKPVDNKLVDSDINEKIKEIFDKNKKIEKLIEKLFMNRKKSTIKWVN